MPVPRPFETIRTAAQWRLAAYDNTALHGDVVQLARVKEGAADSETAAVETAAGLAFDSHCRLYHSLPGKGRIERVPWGAEDPLQPRKPQPTPIEPFQFPEPRLGEFKPVEKPAELAQPTGLAVDEDDRLFIAETGARRILVFDLWSRRLLRTISVAGRPIDLATDGHWVYALLRSPKGLVQLDARSSARALDLPESITDPTRIACSPRGRLFLLDRGGTADAAVVALGPRQQVVRLSIFQSNNEPEMGLS